MTQISEQAKAEGRAMTDKELVDKLDAWLFNLRLECSGGSLSAIEEVAIGGAVLKLSDLLDVLEWVAALTAFNTAEGGRQHIKDTDSHE